MTAPDLKHCPHCGSSLGPFVAHLEDRRRQVVCSTCGMRGPYETQTSTAEAGWNALAALRARGDA